MTPFKAELLFMKDNLMVETKSGQLLIPGNWDGFRLKSESQIYDLIREISFVLLFPAFVTNAILASEEDPNEDHDDEDGETKIETAIQYNLDIHAYSLFIMVWLGWESLFD